MFPDILQLCIVPNQYALINCSSASSLETTKPTVNCISKTLLNPKVQNICQLHADSLISCLRASSCDGLSFYEETKLYHLSSIAEDWTLHIDRLAANCRNISDEVFPGIHLGDRYVNWHPGSFCIG